MVKPYFRQSNIDLSFQLTGGLDNFISLCNQNGITNIAVESINPYNVNTDLITNSNNTGKQYATKIKDTVIDNSDYDPNDYDPNDYA